MPSPISPGINPVTSTSGSPSPVPVMAVVVVSSTDCDFDSSNGPSPFVSDDCLLLSPGAGSAIAPSAVSLDVGWPTGNLVRSEVLLSSFVARSPPWRSLSSRHKFIKTSSERAFGSTPSSMGHPLFPNSRITFAWCCSYAFDSALNSSPFLSTGPGALNL